MTIQLFPCGHAPCGCPECGMKIYDIQSADGYGARLVYIDDVEYMTEAAVTYEVDGVPTSVGLTLLTSTQKLCWWGEPDGSITGRKWYTLSIPMGAVLTDVGYTIDPPDEAPYNVSFEVAPCTFGTEAEPVVTVVECFTPSTVSSGSSCGSEPTGGTASNGIFVTPSASPSVCTGTWCTTHYRYRVADSACNDTFSESGGAAGAMHCYRASISSDVYGWSLRRFELPFSATITHTWGSVSVSGRAYKNASGTLGIDVTHVQAQAAEVAVPGPGAAVSCTGAQPCIDTGVNDAWHEVESLVLPCSSLRIVVEARCIFERYNTTGGPTECCRCTAQADGTKVKGAQNRAYCSAVRLSLKAI